MKINKFSGILALACLLLCSCTGLRKLPVTLSSQKLVYQATLCQPKQDSCAMAGISNQVGNNGPLQAVEASQENINPKSATAFHPVKISKTPFAFLTDLKTKITGELAKPIRLLEAQKNTASASTSSGKGKFAIMGLVFLILGIVFLLLTAVPDIGAATSFIGWLFIVCGILFIIFGLKG